MHFLKLQAVPRAAVAHIVPKLKKKSHTNSVFTEIELENHSSVIWN